MLGAIFLMVLVLLRDWALSGFMVAGTILSYLATLGLAHWAFAAVGSGGLDWKVEVFLFVVMVAVGVDYSIFLAARVAQEARGARPPRRHDGQSSTPARSYPPAGSSWPPRWAA